MQQGLLACRPSRYAPMGIAQVKTGNGTGMIGSNMQAELRAFFAVRRRAVLAVLALSSALNILLLAGSLYMMLVYDSVLPSHNVSTLLGLLVMLIVVYAFQAVIENLRSQLLEHMAIAFDAQFSRRVQQAMSALAHRGQKSAGDGLTAMRDLDQLRAFLSSSAPGTLLDAPWVVFFILVLALLHVWLAITALAGALVLLGLARLTNRLTRDGTQRVAALTAYRNASAETHLRHVDMLSAMGMRGRLLDRWQRLNNEYLAAHSQLASRINKLGGLGRVFRMLLQSLVLTVGALLVIDGKASGGMIFASSILVGRALAPIDQAIANWRTFAATRLSFERLSQLLAQVPPDDGISVALPPPVSELKLTGVAVAPPGTRQLAVQGVTFHLRAGSAVAIIGPSGAGKSSLARAIVGAWPPVAGDVRLDGATLDQWSPEELGRHFGYLPQSVELLDGTIFENIARFDAYASSEAVIAAAKAAGVHDMIVGFAEGYEARVGYEGEHLSAGQRQRIGLARALYGNPFLVVLDEPNSNLDSDGENALDCAIQQLLARNAIVVLVAHRPSALASVDHVLMLRDGRMAAFGPKNEVLEKFVSRPGKIGGNAGQAKAGEPGKVRTHG